MNVKVERQLQSRKRRIEKRLDKTKFGDHCPVISASNISYEISDKTQATSAGGIGLIHRMVKVVGLDQAINRYVNLLKLYIVDGFNEFWRQFFKLWMRPDKNRFQPNFVWEGN